MGSIAEFKRQRKVSGDVTIQQQNQSNMKDRQKRVAKKMSRDSGNYGKTPRGNHNVGRRERMW